MLETVDVFEYDARREVVSNDSNVHDDASRGDVAWLGRHLIGICENEGWTCQIEEGSGLWKETMLKQQGWINPTFDPEKSIVDESNTASVVIRDADSDFVACNALRLFVTKSFREVIRTGELFYGPSMRLINGLPMILPEDFEDFSGRVGYSGGTLISPRYRGKRLGLLTTRFVRLLADRWFDASHHAGHIFQNRPLDPWPRHPYHFTRCTPCLPALEIPDRSQSQLLFLVDISQAEFLAQVRRNVRKLVREGDQTLDDLALLVA